MNSHLKELNLAAAGLAHETRNPLNIIRGQAQMISRLPDTPPEVREKSKTIVDETDKVTAQLTEFINYSRPREVRRTKVALTAACQEMVRTLGYDMEEKKLRVEVTGEPLAVEADEQLLRQVLFNLLLNAIQAVDEMEKFRSPFCALVPARLLWKFATTGLACRRNPAGRFSSRISPRTRKAPASAWPSCSKSCWRTAGTSRAWQRAARGGLPNHPPENCRLIFAPAAVGANETRQARRMFAVQHICFAVKFARRTWGS